MIFQPIKKNIDLVKRRFHEKRKKDFYLRHTFSAIFLGIAHWSRTATALVDYIKKKC